jgi:hypothetical protein
MGSRLRQSGKLASKVLDRSDFVTRRRADTAVLA